jgi:hypothetical protein
MKADNKDPMTFFSKIIVSRRYEKMTYTVAAPAGAMEAVLLIAGTRGTGWFLYWERAGSGQTTVRSGSAVTVRGLVYVNDNSQRLEARYEYDEVYV